MKMICGQVENSNKITCFPLLGLDCAQWEPAATLWIVYRSRLHFPLVEHLVFIDISSG